MEGRKGKEEGRDEIKRALPDSHFKIPYESIVFVVFSVIESSQEAC